VSLEERGQYEAVYRSLDDSALLQVAIDGGIKDDAKVALRDEMARRSLTGKDVQELRRWRKKQKSPKPGPVQESLFLGMGIKFVGRKFLSERDKEKGIYVSTKFFVLKYGSFFPLGSYRLKESDHGLPKKIERIKLQGDQVWQEMKWDALTLLILVVIAMASICLDRHKSPVDLILHGFRGH